MGGGREWGEGESGGERERESGGRERESGGRERENERMIIVYKSVNDCMHYTDTL